MKWKMRALPAAVLSVFLFGSSPAHAAMPTDTLLSVPLKAQEHDQWCWAGASQAVLAYYGSVVDQCVIANWAWGRSDCCGNATFSWTNTGCNWWNYMWGPNNGHDVPGGSLQGILTHWGVNSSVVYSALSQPTSVAEIDANRPFVMRFGWTSGGGHFLDGYGYDLNGQYLDYMDPWPGNGYTKSLYTWVASAADHTWTHSLQITSPPAKPNLVPYKPTGWSDKIVVAKTAATITDSTPLYNIDPLYVDWAVANNSTVTIPATFATKLYVDNVERNTWSQTGLNGGNYTYAIDYSIGTLGAGQHTIKVVTDTAGVVDESKETDNSYVKTISVLLSPVRIGGASPAYYATILAAYNAAVDGDVIQIEASTYNEALDLSRVDIPGLSLTLEGGYDAAYADNAGYTTIAAPLTIGKGVITVDNIVL